VFLTSWRNTAGEYAIEVVVKDWDTVKEQLGGTARLVDKDGRPRIVDSLRVGPLTQSDVRERGFVWLAERVNTFVNVLRPRIRSAAAEYKAKSE
jgi:hypothetical protein